MSLGDLNLNYTTEMEPEASTDGQVADFLRSHWGSTGIASRGKLTDASAISRVIATDAQKHIMGLATFTIDDRAKSCEIVSLNAVIARHGIGTELIRNVTEAASNAGCKKLWLITTNASPEAAVFYVHTGFRLVAVHLDALDKSRQLKPAIPLANERGIPVQDEWEFQKSLI